MKVANKYLLTDGKMMIMRIMGNWDEFKSFLLESGRKKKESGTKKKGKETKKA